MQICRGKAFWAKGQVSVKHPVCSKNISETGVLVVENGGEEKLLGLYDLLGHLWCLLYEINGSITKFSLRNYII